MLCENEGDSAFIKTYQCYLLKAEVKMIMCCSTAQTKETFREVKNTY